MKMLMLMLILLSTNLLFMKHPLSMGCILLLQTIISSLSCGLILNSHFMSYILFLIFIGGMLILFMYMSSIASNEKFYFSMKLMLMNFYMIIMLMIINFNNFDNHNLKMLINSNEYYNYFMNKLYMLPSGNITLMMMIYLLFTLIIISNIIKVNNVPLRSN